MVRRTMSAAIGFARVFGYKINMLHSKKIGVSKIFFFFLEKIISAPFLVLRFDVFSYLYKKFIYGTFF